MEVTECSFHFTYMCMSLLLKLMLANRLHEKSFFISYLPRCNFSALNLIDVPIPKVAQIIRLCIFFQAFDSVTLAIQHKFRKHPESAAKHFCPYCGMQFPLRINRDKHTSAEHPDCTPSKLLPCGDCGVVFYTDEAEAYHSKSTHKRYVQYNTEQSICRWNKKGTIFNHV